MKPINNTVNDLFQPRELAADEYLNEADGLIYCSKCHTPRQHRIELKERVYRLWLLSKCFLERGRTDFLAKGSSPLSGIH